MGDDKRMTAIMGIGLMVMLWGILEKLVESMDGHRMLAAAIELSREEGVQQVTWTQMSARSVRRECEMLVKRQGRLLLTKPWRAISSATSAYLIGRGGMRAKCVCGDKSLGSR